MKALIGLILLTLTACAAVPTITETIVTVPCPKRPHVERPVLQPIPADAAIDQVVVIVKRALLDYIAYADELSKVEGCN